MPGIAFSLPGVHASCRPISQERKLGDRTIMWFAQDHRVRSLTRSPWCQSAGPSGAAFPGVRGRGVNLDWKSIS